MHESSQLSGMKGLQAVWFFHVQERDGLFGGVERVGDWVAVVSQSANAFASHWDLSEQSFSRF